MKGAFEQIANVRQQFARRARRVMSTKRGEVRRRVCYRYAAAIRYGRD